VKETPLLRRRIGMKCTFQGRGSPLHLLVVGLPSMGSGLCTPTPRALTPVAPRPERVPDNVHETGVWSGGQSGFPILAAEAEQVERTRRKDLVTGRIRVSVPFTPVGVSEVRVLADLGGWLRVVDAGVGEFGG